MYRFKVLSAFVILISLLSRSTAGIALNIDDTGESQAGPDLFLILLH